MIDLGTIEQAQLMGEIAAASRTLKAMTGCDKINVAALGNVVAQLHVHVIARSRGDAAWPKPVWGAVPARAYDPAAAGALIARVRTAGARMASRDLTGLPHRSNVRPPCPPIPNSAPAPVSATRRA